MGSPPTRSPSTGPKSRYQHLMAMRSLLLDTNTKPATINHTLAAVRGTLREAWRLGYLTAEDLARATDVANVKATMLPAGRHVDVGEVTALFRACGDAPVGARDAAMLSLLYGCGLRRSEAVALLLDDYDQGAVTIHHGKGRKERIVYCPAGGREAIDAWITRRGPWPGALLCPVKKGGQHPAKGHDRPGSSAAPPVSRRSRPRADVLASRPAPVVRRRAARRRRRHLQRPAVGRSRLGYNDPAL